MGLTIPAPHDIIPPVLNDSPSLLARKTAWGLFLLGIALYMLLSAQGLSALGIAYDSPGGPVFAKLHPGTLLILAAYGLMLCAYGHPMRVAASVSAAQPLLAVYVLCQFVMLAWLLVRHGISGAANVVDTLLMPFVCVCVQQMVGSRWRYACLEMITLLLLLNALIGLGEAVAHARIIPYRVGSEDVIESIFRPTALLGHPLTNSMITATLLPMVFYLRIPVACRVALALLFWLAVLAFGGRTAFVLSTVAYGAYAGLHVFRSTLQGRYGYLQLTGGAIAGVLALGAIAGVVMASGIGERIFESLSWDGSAAVRVRIWEVFGHMDMEDLWFGMSNERVAAVGSRIGLAGSEAIENFWLVELMQAGLVGFAPYLVGMACMAAWLWKSSRGLMRVSVCLFFLIASSSNSLATKSIILVMLAVVVAITRNLHLPAAEPGRQLTPVPA